MVDVKNTTYKKQGQCPFCGKPCKLNAKKCVQCRSDNNGKIARKLFFDELRARPCIQCGRPLNSTDRRKIACSNECGYKNRLKEKIEVPCLVCGKLVVRYKHEMEIHNGACCSPLCQRVWAGRNGNGRNINWLSRSKRARDKYKAESTRNRKRKSVEYRWWLLAKAQSLEQQLLDEWDTRCQSAVTSLNTRSLRFRSKAKRKCSKNWGWTLSSAVALLRSKMHARSLTGWDAKCVSVAANIKKRIKG